MPSFQDITQLRKSGHIDEAYKMAADALQQSPADIWFKRAMAWVLYDLLKKEAENARFNEFLLRMEEVKKLNLTEEEQIFFENLPWTIFFMVEKFALDDFVSCDRLFNAIRPIQFVPCTAYSVMFKAFHKHRGGWNSYPDFCEWWNFDHFTPDDYREFVFKNEKTHKRQSVMALAEQAYIGYANALISCGNTAKIHTFLPKIMELAQQHPNYTYPPYFISKLYMAIGEKVPAFHAILPFVKTKPNDFWVWQCLGDAAPDSTIRFACYSRALTCPAKPSMLVSVKMKYAEMLVDCGFFNEARTEADAVLRIRQKEGWRIPDQLMRMLHSEWYAHARSHPDNTAFYAQYVNDAELLIYPDIHQQEAMIIEINTKLQIANFVQTDGRRGSFNYRKLRLLKLKVGQVVMLKIRKTKNNGFADVISCTAVADTSQWTECCCRFSGRVHLFEGKCFGIVACSDRKHVFLSPTLATGHNNGDSVSGRAVRTFDTKQNKMGWNAISIDINK